MQLAVLNSPPEGLRQARHRLGRAFGLFAPPPKLSISEWANRYRFLSAESSAEHGKFSTDRAPYQKEMLDAVLDPDVEDVVYMLASQTSKTETLNNIIGYFIDQDPSPILVVQPTVEMAEAWSKDRLAPMVRDTPRLKGKINEARSRDSGNTILHKRFPGGHLTAVGANAPSGLASRPIRVVLCDEVDRFPKSAGTEGDPRSLAFRRADTFWNRKKVQSSTPTVKGESPIEDAYEASDQRKYYIPCPHCGHEQIFKWREKDGSFRIVWRKDSDGNDLPETACFTCEKCGALIEEHEKPEMLRKGRWIKTFPERKSAGFWLNSLYSPFRRWAEIVGEWLKIIRTGNPQELKSFINTVLCETWEEEGDRLEASSLKARLEEYPSREDGENVIELVPAAVGFLVAAVDVQDDRLECKVKGYGEGEESWLIALNQIHGDPGIEGKGSVWEELDSFLDEEYEHESGAKLKASVTVVDSGDGGHTDEVYRYCKPRQSRGVYAIKGQGGVREIVGRPSFNNKYRAKVWIVGVDSAKDTVYSRMQVQVPGPQFMHLPNWVDGEYLAQLTSEKKVRKYVKGKGTKRQWVKTRARNEGWDLEVYCLAALYTKGQPFIQRLGEKAKELKANNRPGPESAPSTPDTGRNPFGGFGTGGSWVTKF